MNKAYSVRFQVLTATSMKLRFVFWDILQCKIIVDRRFRGTCSLHHQGDECSQNTNLNAYSIIVVAKINTRRRCGVINCEWLQMWTEQVTSWYERDVYAFWFATTCHWNRYETWFACWHSILFNVEHGAFCPVPLSNFTDFMLGELFT
jgi:hypothetical protein